MFGLFRRRLLAGLVVIITTLGIFGACVGLFYPCTTYRRLRVIEMESQAKLTIPKVVALQTELENIDQAASILPMRHSDLFLILIATLSPRVCVSPRVSLRRGARQSTLLRACTHKLISKLLAYVRCGSFTSVRACIWHFRCSPNCGHIAALRQVT